MDSMAINGTDTKDEDVALLVDVVYCYVMPVLIFTGVLTNFINILTLWSASHLTRRQPQHVQSATYRYLFWLAVTDLLASVSIVFSIANLERSELPYAWACYYAHVETPLMNGLTSASVYIVVGLSVDRYFAVCWPRHYKEVSAPRWATVRIACSFIVPVLLYLPHVFFMEAVPADSGNGYTYDLVDALYPGAKHWQSFVELCHRIFPAVILIVLNGCIIYSFNKAAARRRQWKSKSPLSAESSTASKKSKEQANRQESRLFYLLIAIVVSFLLTNLPCAVLTIIDFDGPSHGSFSLEVFRALANCLEAFGLSMNFVLYFVFMKEVRTSLKKANFTERCSSSNYSNSNSTELVDL